MNWPSPAQISLRFLRVWQRNFSVYRRTWIISFLPPLLEPVLYILAFGLGLGALVGDLQTGTQSVSYTTFIAPGLVAVAIMYNAFFETSYNSFVRMYYQKTYDALLATPLNLYEVILGDIVWAATKSLIAALLMGTMLTLFGLLILPGALLLIPLALLGGLFFAALGMVCTGLVPGIETFNVPIFLLITPMFLFSGTFFPLQQLPQWAQQVALALPLTHLVNLARAAALGDLSSISLWSIGYLLAGSLLLVPLALVLMHRRIID
jgi:lipooligosaccharide transport system permease protein